MREGGAVIGFGDNVTDEQALKILDQVIRDTREGEVRAFNDFL